MLLAWTIDGATPTEATCAGVDHVSMSWSTSGCTQRIAPIPCALDKWRDERPTQGTGTVELELFGANERSIGYGSTRVTVGANVPSMPIEIAIDRF